MHALKAVLLYTKVQLEKKVQLGRDKVFDILKQFEEKVYPVIAVSRPNIAIQKSRAMSKELLLLFL